MSIKMPSSDMGKPTFQLALIRAILESSPDGILVVNKEGVIEFYNNRFIEVWKLPFDPETKGTANVHVGGEDAPLLSRVVALVSDSQSFLKRVQALYEHPELKDFCEIALKDGRTLERHSTALKGENNEYFGRVWYFRDITPHKKIEMDLGELTRRDPLTNIANRRYFFERSNQEYKRARRYLTPLCIASIDIDHFKRINDTFGHDAGDKMLISVCVACQKNLRKTELLARIGGEEFALLMPDTPLNGALYLAERLRISVEENKIVYNEHEIRCTISIGVAELKLIDGSINDCLNRADLAMYRAKEKGRNRVENG